MARGLRSVGSHAAKDEASSLHEATSPSQTQQAPPTSAIQPAPPASAVPMIQSVPIAQL